MTASNFFRQYRSGLAKEFTLREIFKTLAKAVTSILSIALVLHLTGQDTLVYAYMNAHHAQLREVVFLYVLLNPFVRFVVTLGVGVVYSIVKVFSDLLPERSQVQA